LLELKYVLKHNVARMLLPATKSRYSCLHARFIIYMPLPMFVLIPFLVLYFVCNMDYKWMVQRKNCMTGVMCLVHRDKSNPLITT